MNYEHAEKEVATENTLIRKELYEKCYSLEESKRLLLKKVHYHYAVHSLLYH